MADEAQPTSEEPITEGVNHCGQHSAGSAEPLGPIEGISDQNVPEQSMNSSETTLDTTADQETD